LATSKADADTDIPMTRGVPRVRSDNLAIAMLLREGARRSPTFEALVQSIDDTDGIVFVEAGRCGHGVRACLLLSVKMAGPSRLLRIVLDARKADWDLIGSLGHELRHAVEVLSDSTVASSGAIYFFYQRIGATSAGRFETLAAVKTGDTIRAEVRRAPGFQPVGDP
jgi:hypothetical protein